MLHPAYELPLRFVLMLRLQKGGLNCGILRYIIYILLSRVYKCIKSCSGGGGGGRGISTVPTVGKVI